MTEQQKTLDESKIIPKKSEAERRRHTRIKVPLKARFLTPDGIERPCLVSNISAGGALLRAKQTPNKGENIVIYIDDVGRFEASIVRSGAHSFAIAYKSRGVKQNRTADALIEVVNRGSKANDRRIAPRVCHDESAFVRLQDGEEMKCVILDISLTGASIEINPRPPLKSQLTLGRMSATVMRYHEKGVGVVFTGPATRMDDVYNQTKGQ